jgi:acyl-CoA synthetase (AMP-forming)/AMP-acid ligase II
MPSIDVLRDRIGDTTGRFLASDRSHVSLSDLAHGSVFSTRLRELAGRSVLVATCNQLATALTLFELDGVAARLCVCPPEVAGEQILAVIESGRIDRVVCDADRAADDRFGGCAQIRPGPLVRYDIGTVPRQQTEWILLTSGTTDAPKMLAHTMRSLTATTKVGADGSRRPVWGSLYDIWRFAGLQVFFQAMLGGGSLVLPSPAEPLTDYILRLAGSKVTHMSGTPTQWRRVLMSSSVQALAPHQITLGGEVADQGILNKLMQAFPEARITHIYASTEAGVGFAVRDGLAGFPASFIGRMPDGTELRVNDGSLYIRSDRTTRRSLQADRSPAIDEDGFLDTGDLVGLRDDRYHFLGRRDGTINVGGLKIHPEEVEAVINSHPAVRYSRVRARKNPITGALVIAEIVLNESEQAGADAAAIRREIHRLCKEKLADHQVPAMISIADDLQITAGGKLERHNA